jgi:hypothetical protein
MENFLSTLIDNDLSDSDSESNSNLDVDIAKIPHKTVKLIQDDASILYEDEKLIEQIKDLRAMETNKLDKYPKDILFDPLYNICDEVVREEFKNEVIFKENDLFTSPISTTNTLGGFITNVKFLEEELIKLVETDTNIVRYKCNYGEIVYEDYVEIVSVKKSKKGRKKNPIKKKNRKKQGNGNSFNSQLTFVVRNMERPGGENILYKFKIFRTGMLQLPGVNQEYIDDVIKCAKFILQTLNKHLHNSEPVSQLLHINPVMKNYKFVIKIPKDHIIDLMYLRDILNKYQNNTEECYPKIFVVKYTRQDTKLAVKFNTPIFKKPNKKTRINIFMRGKVNILGGFDSYISEQICNFLYWIFKENKDKLIQKESIVEDYYKEIIIDTTECDSILTDFLIREENKYHINVTKKENELFLKDIEEYSQQFL